MPHFAERVRSAAEKKRAQMSAAPAPKPGRTGPQRGTLWHILQLKAAQTVVPAPGAPSRSALPAQLKAGVESLSGIAMDDVRVHRNSPEPARLGALAYTQGSDIHLGPGQDRHLPHEAWHVVQQKQGRVQATTQLKGMGLNDDQQLEREADAMGARTIAAAAESPVPVAPIPRSPPAQAAVQRMSIKGTAIVSEVSPATLAKHVVATNDQAEAAKANEGSTTYVTAASALTDAVNANAYNFPLAKSEYLEFYAQVTVSRYSKTGDQDAGKAVQRDINATATECLIGVDKTRSRKIKVSHFRTRY